MYPYQQQYQPQYREYRVGQPVPPAAAPSSVAVVPVAAEPSAGWKVAQTLLTLGFTGAVAYTGITAGMKEKGAKSAAGWVAGLGGALLGVAALTAVASPSFASKIAPPFRFA